MNCGVNPAPGTEHSQPCGLGFHPLLQGLSPLCVHDPRCSPPPPGGGEQTDRIQLSVGKSLTLLKLGEEKRKDVPSKSSRVSSMRFDWLPRLLCHLFLYNDHALV